MDIQCIKLKDVHIEQVKNNTPEYVERQIPKGMPRLHMLAAIIGSRNSGKTTTCIQLLKMYQKAKSYDKIVWFSPTASREQKMKAFVQDSPKHCPVEIIDKFSVEEFQGLIEWIKTEIDEYKQYLKDVELYKKFQRTKNEDDLTHEELLRLDEMDWSQPKTNYIYGYPSFGVVFDDNIGDKNVFSPTCKGVTSNFWILHRHLSCSVFILSQIVANGIPRQIRGNISLWILFSCKSDSLKNEIAKELAFKCKPERFLDMWEFATQNQHDFLFADYDANQDQMFRKNFDTLLMG
jgi:hypothetical protein